MKCLQSSCICHIPKACLRLGVHALRAFCLITLEQKVELLEGLQKKPGEDSYESRDSPGNNSPRKDSNHRLALSVVD